jgi:hypothetical protein
LQKFNVVRQLGLLALAIEIYYPEPGHFGSGLEGPYKHFLNGLLLQKEGRVASTPGKLLSYVTDCPFLMVELHKKPLAKFLGLPEELPSSISLEGGARQSVSISQR